jgi:hypothetical protein
LLVKQKHNHKGLKMKGKKKGTKKVMPKKK